MKLSTWAKKNGIDYGTALKWFHRGILPAKAFQLPTGTILIEENQNVNDEIKKTFIYARVSSSNKKSDLQSQAELCQQFCISKGWNIEKVVKEIASGMNDNRPKLNKLLELHNARIVCLHKDRLTRFGFNYISKIVSSRGGDLIVINSEAIEEDDLLKDQFY